MSKWPRIFRQTAVIGLALMGFILSAQALTLQEGFSGRTIGQGVVSLPIAGVERTFCVVTRGTMRGSTLTLVEDFFYNDGEKERKTWRFTKVSPGRYAGTREDVVGQAAVWEENNRLRLSYDIKLTAKGGGPAVWLHFEDVLVRDPDGLIVNDAQISLIGLPIGSGRVVFSRATQRSGAKKGCNRS